MIILVMILAGAVIYFWLLGEKRDRKCDEYWQRYVDACVRLHDMRFLVNGVIVEMVTEGGHKKYIEKLRKIVDEFDEEEE